MRADSAYYQRGFVTVALRARARVSVGARLDPAVRRAIAGIDDTAWTRVASPQAALDPDTGELCSIALMCISMPSQRSRRCPPRVQIAGSRPCLAQRFTQVA